MGQAVLVLHGDRERQLAKRWIDGARALSRITFKGPARSLPQNDKLWAMLTDVSQQRDHHGLKLTPDDWKHLFTAALRRELRLVPNLSGDGFVQLGGSTSQMDREELAELIEFIYAWGAQNGIVWREPKEQAA